MRSKLIFCLLGLALIATMALTGCFGSSSDGDNYVPVSGTTIKGSISTVATSMRADLKAVVAPTSAVISFNYIDANGNPVPLVSGINVTFNGTTATYEFSVNIPLAALQYRNFLLIATPNVGDPIEGIIPFDPTGETAVTAPPINPNDAGPVAFVKLMAKAGTPNVGMGDVLSIYTPADIKAMINTANMTTLVARFKEREQAMEQMRTEFSAQATNIQKLMNYSAQLARDPEYMGFDNREKFEAAMKAKAAELGLPYDAMAAIDAMESQFIGSGLPTPASQPALNFDNLSNASEQKRELESLNLALQYFAGVLNNGDLNTIRSRFMTAADAFFAQIMTGNPPQPGTTNHPFFILDEAREIIFTQLGTVVKGVILVKPADMQTLGQLGATATPEQIIANKKALFALVIGRINAEYANLTGAPTAAAEKEKFIQALAALTSIVMAGVNDQPVQPGTVGNTTISGSISATTNASMRAVVVPPTSATVNFCYLDANGNPVTIMTGFVITFTGNVANYEFKVNIPAAALQYRNFLLIATPNTGDPIEGVIPFDPNSETNITAPAIDPNDAGPVAFVKLMAKAGAPNVGMGDVLSIYTPADLKAMIETANMTTLVAKFQEREQAMEQMKTEFSAQATNIQELMNYSAQLARDPEYMGFANREKFEAAMKAKAAELGLPYDAMAAIDTMESQFIGSGLPTPPSQPTLNFDNFSNASEQKREIENLGLALQYFANLLNNGDLNAIRTRFMAAAGTFFAQTLAGAQIQPGSHPFFILDEAREIIFAQLGTVVKGVILIKPVDMQTLGQLGEMPTPEQIIANKKALFTLVIGRINAEYANLTGAPTAEAEKEKFIQALAALTSIVMAPAQP